MLATKFWNRGNDDCSITLQVHLTLFKFSNHLMLLTLLHVLEAHRFAAIVYWKLPEVDFSTFLTLVKKMTSSVESGLAKASRLILVTVSHD